MFSHFKKKFFKKDIRLVCFDIDNTLCDFSNAEAITETYLMELISKEIKKIQLLNTPRGRSKNVKARDAKTKIVFDSCSPFTILKLFNDVKNYHMHNGNEPEKYSRELWFKETIEKLDESMNLGISMNTLMQRSDAYEKIYWDSIIKNIKNYPNTIYTLEFLKLNGFKVATITDSDGRRDIKMMRLDKMGLTKYFNYIITTDDTKLTKPAEINWIRLLEISHFKANQCIMVGDHPEIDLVTAKKLGFTTVWTKERLNTDLSQRYVDYEIHDIKEILDIVKKISK